MSLNGIDISAWQDGIDVASVPADFVICKATEGTTYTDRCCDAIYQAAVASGKMVGVYHYADGDAGAQAEADYFVDAIQGYIGQALLILDWEAGGNSAFGSVAYAKAILDRIYERTGIKPIIYMSGSVCREYDWSSVVNSDYGLWQAYYSVDGGGYQPDCDTYSQPYWPDVAMLQYTSGGSLSGYGGNLDLNVFYGDAAAWAAYAGGSGAQPVTPTPAPEPTPEDSGYVWSVLNIQYWANICNYGAPDLDGIDGPETQACVANGQRAYGITADGLFGPTTQGCAEVQVRQYQTKLNEKGCACAMDGVAGPETYAAVKRFQTERGLSADGIVGSATFPVLMA